jgi:hypothetical protein
MSSGATQPATVAISRIAAESPSPPAAVNGPRSPLAAALKPTTSPTASAAIQANARSQRHLPNASTPSEPITTNANSFRSLAIDDVSIC